MDNKGKDNIWSLANCKSTFTYKNISWWLVLAITVLAVPSLAVSLTSIVHASGISETVIFIGTCWMCVFFGMRLMKSQRITSIMFEHVTLSEQSKQRTINMISMIESETIKWKKRYEKCEPVFMSLSKQPAWNYLDEVIQVLALIKHSAEKDSTIDFTEIKALHIWLDSSKPRVIEGYLHTLETIYGYAKVEFAQQNKNIDELYPELAKGQIDTFIKIPAYAINFSNELWKILEKEHPALMHSNVLKTPVSMVA